MMIKSLGIAVWACAAMFGASYGANIFLKSRSAPPTVAQQAAGSETRKTKELNVPILRDGAVKGYVALQLSYVVDLAVAKTLPVQPDAFVIDESFRYIFDDDKIDFNHLDKIEIEKLAREITYKVNTRMKAQVITEMGVLECNFLLNAESKIESNLKKAPDQ
jgi:hypothetical protein